jgi:hypothetical protein
MNPLHRNVVGVLLLVAMSGCATTRGPSPILSARGVIDTSATTGVAKRFIDDAKDSYDHPQDAPKAQAMLRTGFTLVYANCSDFFQSAGQTQKWIVFSRDTVGAVGTLGTAVMALHNAGKNAVSNVAFVTGAAFTGLDLYTKDFLFAAENVDSVRELTLKALGVHQAAVGIDPQESYESATVALLDNQNICSPMSIAALAREAIKKGDVVAAQDASEDLSALTRAQDKAVLLGLGRTLHPPGALTVDQAGALWWLLREAPTDAQRKVIAGKLAGLDADKSPFDAKGAYKTDWALLDPVNTLLGNFSAATQHSFADAIAATPPPAAPAGAGLALAAPAAPIVLAAPVRQQRVRHVSVRIKSSD